MNDSELIAKLQTKNEALRKLLKEARSIIRASSSRQLAKDWDRRATEELK